MKRNVFLVFLNQTEEYEKAYSSFNTAIMLNPSHAHAHDEIGDVYLYNYGDFDKAIIWYDKALKRDPESCQQNGLNLKYC